MKLKLILLAAFLLYLPSLFNYYSHDDFFNLQLAKVNNVGDFLQFFNLLDAPDRVGSYRPLTTQVYFLTSRLLNFSSVPLHLIAFVIFLGDIVLVQKLTKLLLKNEASSLIAAFLYAVSATHFAHLYWPSLFQELGLTFFFLLSIIFFIENKFSYSLFALLGALMSKETAIMIPVVLTAIVVLEKSWKKIKILVPYFLIVGIYLFLHLFFFGLPLGNVYKMDLSLKIFNTFMWYVLWAFNLPELFVDFIGPGFHLNPNLLNFYGKETFVILTCFLGTIISLVFILKQKINIKIFLLCAGWFVITLTPVIFLPWHKFTYELGVPLIGLAIFLGGLTKQTSRIFLSIFCLAWFLTSFFTLNLTTKTHWITLGPKITARVKTYFESYHGKNNIIFYDTANDKNLPWGPANELKINLFDNEFFEVYYPGKYRVTYLSKLPGISDTKTTYIPARQFLGY